MKYYDKSLGYPKTLKGIQKFIEDYEVDNVKDLENNKLFGLSAYIKKNKWNRLLKYPNARTPKNQEIVQLESLEDFQKFIDSHGILRASDFKKKFPGGYVKLARKKLASEVKYPDPIDKYSEYAKMSVEEIQNLIIENKCVSLSDVGRKISHSLKRYMSDNPKSFESIVYTRKKTDYSGEVLDTLEDFQRFIDSREDITTITSLHDKYNFVYKKALTLGIIRKLVFPIPIKGADWKEISCLEDVLREIQERKIPTATVLNKEYPGLYKKCQKLGINYNKLIYYTDDLLSGFGSSWEKKLFDLIVSSTPYLVEHHIRLPDLQDKKKLEMDLKVINPQNNKYLYIEIEGPSHFSDIFGGGEKHYLVRKHDIMKHRWAKKNGISLLLFSYLDSTIIDDLGFPYYVFRKEEDLLNEINLLLNDSK